MIGEMCQKHFYILHHDDSVLYTVVYIRVSFCYFPQSMDICIGLS